MDPVADLQTGFKDALMHKNMQWDWTTQDTLILSIVILLFAVAILSNHLFSRYRFFVRTHRKQMKKREFLGRLLCDMDFDRDAETALLKRVIKYYGLNETSNKLVAPPEQLMKFSQSLVKLIRRLEYDKRGRLVIPAIEKELEESAKRQATHALDSMPADGAPEGRPEASRSAKPMSKAARVALSFIRFKQGGGKPATQENKS